ncbi:snurportin1 rnut1 protein RNA u transporter 1 [Anaeramoeba ignava]|uniref:Snurportin-1 n=1 Tax=Anaeramoeba ignava TaxID=1746090 RepID=A0A9Q0LG43_ANAIG|nr:snurportin1 rnut1 protein RNA u transporter 1 [Anaeramoeba ignava]
MENEIEIENQNQNQNQNQIEIENLKENQKVDQMQVEKSRKFPKRRQKNKKKNLQKNFHRQFIIPEKLEEIPEDLEENWYSIPIPKEYKRCMIISTGGMTISRQMNGEIIEIFSSLLPGGSFYGSFNKKVFSILDCFYLPQTQKSIENVYYILDVMCWNGCEFYNTEAEFRFFWIASKLQEEPNFSEITQTNKRKFQQLPLFNCNIEDFEKIWKSIEIENEVDSILLYSKKTHYTPGITPLVCQLDPQQLPQLISFLKK